MFITHVGAILHQSIPSHCFAHFPAFFQRLHLFFQGLQMIGQLGDGPPGNGGSGSDHHRDIAKSLDADKELAALSASMGDPTVWAELKRGLASSSEGVAGDQQSSSSKGDGKSAAEEKAYASAPPPLALFPGGGAGGGGTTSAAPSAAPASLSVAALAPTPQSVMRRPPSFRSARRSGASLMSSSLVTCHRNRSMKTPGTSSVVV